MTALSEEQILSDSFYRLYKAFLREQKELRDRFCEVRLNLLQQVHEGRYSKLKFEDSLLNEPLFYGLFDPWETSVSIEGAPFRGEVAYWETLFLDGRQPEGAKRAFIDYFNAFLRKKGIRVHLVEDGKKMVFER